MAKKQAIDLWREVLELGKTGECALKGKTRVHKLTSTSLMEKYACSFSKYASVIPPSDVRSALIQGNCCRSLRQLGRVEC